MCAAWYLAAMNSALLHVRMDNYAGLAAQIMMCSCTFNIAAASNTNGRWDCGGCASVASSQSAAPKPFCAMEFVTFNSITI